MENFNEKVDVIHQGINYRRVYYPKTGVIKWLYISTNISVSNRNIINMLENEYQKNLISTKTPNPQQEGFDIKEFDIIRRALCCYNMDLIERIKIENVDEDYYKMLQQLKKKVNAKIDQANGETPEVDNPVGQDDLKTAFRRILLYYSEESNGTTFHIDKYADKLLRVIKPRETDKVEPIYKLSPKELYNLIYQIQYKKFDNPDAAKALKWLINNGINEF